MGKPEVATILVTLVYWKKFFTPILSIGHYLFENFFSKTHGSRDIGKSEVAAF
jgi:hypothetical protein